MISTSKWQVPIIEVQLSNVSSQFIRASVLDIINDFNAAVPALTASGFDSWRPITVSTQLGVKLICSVPCCIDSQFAILTNASTAMDSFILRKLPGMKTQRSVTAKFIATGAAITCDLTALYNLLLRQAVLTKLQSKVVGAQDELQTIHNQIMKFDSLNFVPTSLYMKTPGGQLLVAGSVGVLSLVHASVQEKSMVSSALTSFLSSVEDLALDRLLIQQGTEPSSISASQRTDLLADSRVAYQTSIDSAFPEVYNLDLIDVAELTASQRTLLSSESLRLVASPSLILDIVNTSNSPLSMDAILSVVKDTVKSVQSYATGDAKSGLLPSYMARSVSEALIQLGVTESRLFLESIDMFYAKKIRPVVVGEDTLLPPERSALATVHPSYFKMMFPSASLVGGVLTYKGMTAEYPAGALNARWQADSPDVFWNTFHALYNTIYSWALLPEGKLQNAPSTLALMGIEGVHPPVGYSV